MREAIVTISYLSRMLVEEAQTADALRERERHASDELSLKKRDCNQLESKVLALETRVGDLQRDHRQVREALCET